MRNFRSAETMIAPKRSKTVRNELSGAEYMVVS